MQRILAYIFFVEAMGVTFLYTIYFNCRKEVEKKKGTVDKKKICVDISTKLYKFDKKKRRGGPGTLMRTYYMVSCQVFPSYAWLLTAVGELCRSARRPYYVLN